MTTEKINEAEKATPKAPTSSGKKMVTSTKTIDFPSLNWGITAGEERELPSDPEAQERILSNHFISLKK